MVVLDTDFLVGILRGNEAALSKANEIEKLNQKVAVTSITSYELFKGAYLSSNPTQNLFEVAKLLDNIDVLSFDLEISRISAKIYFNLKKKGLLTNSMDQMIAAITISKNETLITRNVNHYKNIPNLNNGIPPIL